MDVVIVVLIILIVLFLFVPRIFPVVGVPLSSIGVIFES
jgi:hypothetical protein